MEGSEKKEDNFAPRSKARLCAALFWEFFKIALFVVGGGYAIIVVADNVFGRRLKWLKEGELLEHLPVFQMIPGIIAGNSAIYTGLKLGGLAGAAAGLAGVALPSLVIFTAVSMGYRSIPVDNPVVASAFLGLRSSLVGIIAGTIVSGWRKGTKGPYWYAALAAGVIGQLHFGLPTFWLLVAAMVAGIALEYCGLGTGDIVEASGVELAPISAKNCTRLAVGAAVALILVTVLYGRLYWAFVKFGLICFGGGFVLIPAYIDEFVGEAAPLIKLPMEEFSNLMALTQATPGPVSVNAATFFGFRLAGIAGAVVATAGLFTPGFILLTAALAGIERWKTNRTVRGLLRGVKPATVALMVVASVSFAKLSLWSATETGIRFSPLGVGLCIFAAAALLARKMSVMAIIFTCAAVGAAASFFG